jgi:glycosyltransferase involved in cell wall biosynthesis
MAGTSRKMNHESGALRPVVYLPTWVRWDVMRQRPQFILGALAVSGHPVFFVDPNQSTVRHVDGVTIVPSLKDVPSNDAILYVHFAPALDMAGSFETPAVVYDILDDLSIYDEDEVGLPEHRKVAHHHRSVVTDADVVLVSNDVLAMRHRAERSDLIVVPNGVDPERFRASTTRPGDVPRQGPIIGYHGAIASWFDFDLLAGVARLEPDWQFVLVGPVDDRVRTPAAALNELPNIHLIGERRSDLIPGYVQAFDVGTVWFEVNPMTEGVSPLKVYEYLACGVPVVSTPLPSCVDEEAVLTAGDPSSFRDRIADALASRGEAAWSTLARETVDGAAWDARLAPVLERLDQLGLRRVP